jgi:serine/threonine-protein kinase HipA
VIETGKCLVCYGPLDGVASDCHAACSKSMFDQPEPPAVPYALSELERLAEEIVRSSVTVPGVQEKLSLHLEEAANSAGKLTLVGLWGDYILKPPTRKYPEMPEVEDLTMHLASLWRIETVSHCLIRLRSGELSYITKRIDRNKGKRICHMEDMCQLTERLTEQKYRSSMEKVGKAINRFSSHPLLDITRFFDIALFCFVTGNADMHLKNFSLYYQDEDLVQLAPSYDLISTRLLLSENFYPEEMALSFNGNKAKLKRRDFDVFAKTIGLNEKQLANAYARVVSNIPETRSLIERSFISDEKKEQFKELIGERVMILDL